MELKLVVETKDALSENDKEMIMANIEALLNEVRPDLVSQNVETEILSVQVKE